MFLVLSIQLLHIKFMEKKKIPCHNLSQITLKTFCSYLTPQLHTCSPKKTIKEEFFYRMKTIFTFQSFHIQFQNGTSASWCSLECRHCFISFIGLQWEKLPGFSSSEYIQSNVIYFTNKSNSTSLLFSPAYLLHYHKTLRNSGVNRKLRLQFS